MNVGSIICCWWCIYTAKNTRGRRRRRNRTCKVIAHSKYDLLSDVSIEKTPSRDVRELVTQLIRKAENKPQDYWNLPRPMTSFPTCYCSQSIHVRQKHKRWGLLNNKSSSGKDEGFITKTFIFQQSTKLFDVVWEVNRQHRHVNEVHLINKHLIWGTPHKDTVRTNAV